MSKRRFGYRVDWGYWGFGIAIGRGHLEMGVGPLYLYWATHAR